MDLWRFVFGSPRSREFIRFEVDEILLTDDGLATEASSPERLRLPDVDLGVTQPFSNLDKAVAVG